MPGVESPSPFVLDLCILVSQTKTLYVLFNTIQACLTSLVIYVLLLVYYVDIIYYVMYCTVFFCFIIDTNDSHGSKAFIHVCVSIRDVQKPNFGSVYKNRNQTEAKRSNPKFWFPWLFSKPNLSHTSSQYLSHSHKALIFFTLRTLSDSK